MIVPICFSFPVEHYGKLYGAATIIGAVVLLLQYPIIVIMDGPANSNPYWVSQLLEVIKIYYWR